jgi:hypothetical protein
MKIFKIKKTILAVVAALFLLSTFPILQSCSDDNLNKEEAQQIEYLDLDVSNFKVLTIEQKQILKEAKSRIEPFVVLDGKTYRLTINSASKVNMSERLFDYYEATIKNTNLIIRDLNVVSDKNDPKKLKIILSTNLNSNKRQKIWGYESTPQNGENSWNVDFTGIHVYLDNKTTKDVIDALNKGTLCAGTVAAICGYSGNMPASLVSAIVGLTTDYYANTMSNENEGQGVVVSTGLFGYDIEGR